MKTAENPFSRRTIYILVGVIFVSLLLGFGLAIFGDDLGKPPTADANTYSKSALGHNAFLRLLRKLDVPVVVSQYDSDVKAANSLLIMLEPNVHSENREMAKKIYETADAALIVLPKWEGETDIDDPNRIDEVLLLPSPEVEAALHLVDDEATLVRTAGASAEASFDVVGLEGQPSIVDVQLIESEWIEPIISSDAGILFGKLVDENVWILSDPDLLSNHGLDNGDNSSLAIQSVELARGERSVVVDETLHGFIRQPSLYRTLFEFPLVLVTIQVFLTVLLLIWSATGRFGKPVSRAPQIAPGKEFLINNTAALLRFGGHTAHGLVRYRDVSVEIVARRLHANPGMEVMERVAWLDRIGRARKLEDSLDSIAAEVARVTTTKRPDPHSILAAANRIYRWKQEMINGPTNNK